ncbi:L-dopachrome tautomerase-related protein [Bacteroidota bacterium]
MLTFKSNLLVIGSILVILLLSGPAFAQNYNFSMEEVHNSQTKWTGIAVSNSGRMFVNFPRWSTIPFSVAEIVDGQLIEYPNARWNTWGSSTPPANHFVCVQSVYIDDENFLWILDPASLNGIVIEGGAKLLKIDLESDSVIQKIYFDELTAPPESYLNDIRVDTEKKYAYITESGLGAIIVVDLLNGESRRLLDNHYSTKAEFTTLEINGNTITFVIHADGLALNNDRNYLYYKALTGNSLYRIETNVLTDTTLTPTEVEEAVQFVIDAMPCDAIEFDPDGELYFTAIEENAIYYLTENLEFKIAVDDDRLKWPDSFSITADGEIYVTTSRIYFPPGDHGLFKITKTASDVGDKNNLLPNDFYLFQNYPNPFNPSTVISYPISRRSFVSLNVYDFLGKEIASLVNE